MNTNYSFEKLWVYMNLSLVKKNSNFWAFYKLGNQCLVRSVICPKTPHCKCYSQSHNFDSKYILNRQCNISDINSKVSSNITTLIASPFLTTPRFLAVIIEPAFRMIILATKRKMDERRHCREQKGGGKEELSEDDFRVCRLVDWINGDAVERKRQAQKRSCIVGKEEDRDVMEKKVVMDFCGSLSSASFDILNTHNNAIENSVNTWPIFHWWNEFLYSVLHQLIYEWKLNFTGKWLICDQFN